MALAPMPTHKRFNLAARALTLIVASATLHGCGSMPATPMPEEAQCAPVIPATAALPRIDLQGQLSIKIGALQGQSAKGLSLGFFFAGNTQTGQLDLMTLMGSQVAKVNWSPDQVWLVNDDGPKRFDSLNELSQTVLGEALPLRAMVHWMQGQPDPSLGSQVGAEPGMFTQEGWVIDTRDMDQKKLYAQRAPASGQRTVQIKIYLDR